MPASSSPSSSSLVEEASPPRLVPNTDHPGQLFFQSNPFQSLNPFSNPHNFHSDSSHHSINISIPSSPPPPPPPPRNTPTLDSILQHHLMMLPPHLRTFPTTQNSSIHSQSQSPIHQSPLHYIRVPAPPNSSPSIPSHHPSVPTVPIQYHPSSHMSSYPNFHIPQHPQMSVSQSSINHMLTPPPHPPLSLPHPLLSYIDRSLSMITNDQYRHNAIICSLIRNIRAYMESSSHPHPSTLHTQPPSHQLEESVKGKQQFFQSQIIFSNFRSSPTSHSKQKEKSPIGGLHQRAGRVISLFSVSTVEKNYLGPQKFNSCHTVTSITISQTSIPFSSQSIRIVLNSFQEMAFHSWWGSMSNQPILICIF